MMTSGTDGYYEHAEKYIKLARKFIQAFPQDVTEKPNELFDQSET